MLLVVQISVLVACLAVVVIAVATVRAMRRVEKATDQATKLTGEIEQWIVEARAFTREARETVASARDTIAPLRRVANRFEALGERTADLSAALLGEMEPPLRTAMAVARGVRSGTSYLLDRLSHRFNHGRSATQERSDHE